VDSRAVDFYALTSSSHMVSVKLLAAAEQYLLVDRYDTTSRRI
jgi:hypothetical protein